MSQTALHELDELTEADAADGNPGGSAAPVGALEVTPEEPAVEIPSSIVFITPDGSWVREESPEYFDVLGDMNPDYDAPLYALKNLGFIAVCSSWRKCCIEIKLHPRNVTAAALLSVQNILPSTRRANSFRITYLKDVWTSEVATSATSAICRLSEICAIEGVGITRNEFTAFVH
jgi:hypothetical protein